MGRIFRRRGALDGRRRARRPSPPPGWYLPEVAAGQAELDNFDIVEGLVIGGARPSRSSTPPRCLVASWPGPVVTARLAAGRLVEHWRAHGLPAYARFDNDTIFQGPHRHRDVVGRVTRMNPGLGVTPVFAPPRETGFRAAVENLNGRWQAKVWSRFAHESLVDLQARSDRYVAASRQRAAARIEAAPTRRPAPADWVPDLHAPPRGRIVSLRRADAAGAVGLLGHRYEVAPLWPNRLVRAEVDLDADRIRFYTLRRREPTRQPLLSEVPCSLPRRRF